MQDLCKKSINYRISNSKTLDLLREDGLQHQRMAKTVTNPRVEGESACVSITQKLMTNLLFRSIPSLLVRAHYCKSIVGKVSEEEEHRRLQNLMGLRFWPFFLMPYQLEP